MSTAWAAVVISGVTVVANIFGVIWAGRTQRRLAHLERIGDRRIDTYVELLKWLDTVEANLRSVTGPLDAFEKLRLRDDLRLRIVAFASDRVVGLTREFQNAWLKAHADIKRDEERIREGIRDALAEAREQHATVKEQTVAVGKATMGLVPQYEIAIDVTTQLRDAVRAELTSGTGTWLTSIWRRRATQPHQPV